MEPEKVIIIDVSPVADEGSGKGIGADQLLESEFSVLSAAKRYTNKGKDVAVVRIRPVIDDHDEPQDFLKIPDGEWAKLQAFVSNTADGQPSNDVGLVFISHFNHMPNYYFGRFANNAADEKDLAELTNQFAQHGINWS